MVSIGTAALIVGFVFATYSAVAALVAARTRMAELWRSARNATVLVFVLTSMASFALVWSFFARDFSLQYVAEYSDRSQPALYTFAAWWAGLEGSLLFWSWLLSLFAVILIWQNRRQNQELIPYINVVMMGMMAFFLGIIAFGSSPFQRLPFTPPDGQGLNPLLQNYGMFFHPTTLYGGYVGFTVPFAFAVAAMASGKLDDQWIKSSRRWTLFAWLSLSLGNLFGAQWAYVELGWGGYMGWDPVENASFMPWLTGTAYLHSVMIQQKRGMLKVWNLVLIIVTYALSLFGTMLTRSGILSSVHAFSESSVGPAFILLIAVVSFLSLALLWYRMPRLRSENQLDAFVSRESSFLLNNLLLVGIAFAIFWGTIFPLVSEAVRGTKIVVGPPFYNQVTAPIFLALIALMGVCPLIGWRKASTENLRRNFLQPLAVAAVAGAALYGLGMRPFYAPLAFAALAFVGSSIVLEFYRGARARHRGHGESYLVAVPRLVLANRPRYGGYIVHVGVILLGMGVVASMMFPKSVEATLSPGESATVGSYRLTYEGLSTYTTTRKKVTSAALDVEKNGKPIGRMTSAKIIHGQHENPVTQIGLRSTPLEDLYIIFSNSASDGRANFKFLVNPLVQWLWIGGAVAVLGTLIAWWPERERKAVLYSEEARQVSRQPAELPV